MAFADRFGWLFGHAQEIVEDTKASAASGVMFHRPGTPVWTSRRYDSLAEQGYRINPIVYKCVQLIATSTARLPWVVYRGTQPLEQHPLLALLARPNGQMTGQSLREAPRSPRRRSQDSGSSTGRGLPRAPARPSRRFRPRANCLPG